MKIRNAAGLCVLVAGLAGIASAQNLNMQFGGIINDYSPSTVSGGPWEIRGQWSLNLQGNTGVANFTAALTMETSDYGITDSTAVDPTNTTTRTAHTHHLVMTNATVSYDTSVCPANNPATTGAGIVVTGTLNAAGNGSPAPFESKGSSTLQVCILGGTQVEFSNVSLVFSGAASSHFGPQAIHGVVSQLTTSRQAQQH